jgi:hypothetical protein
LTYSLNHVPRAKVKVGVILDAYSPTRKPSVTVSDGCLETPSLTVLHYIFQVSIPKAIRHGDIETRFVV